MRKRGQAVITDLLVAVGVFIILITVILGTWEIYKLRLTTRLDYDQMSMRNFHALDVLIKTPGVPENWEENVATDINSVTSFGLAYADHMINLEKLEAFMTIQDPDYAECPTSTPECPHNITILKQKLNIAPYGFLLKLIGTNNYSYGPKSTNQKSAVSTSRIVTFQENASVISFTLYS